MTYLLLLRLDFPPKISEGLTRGLRVLRLKRLKLLLVHNEQLLDGRGVEVQVEDVKKVNNFFLDGEHGLLSLFKNWTKLFNSFFYPPHCGSAWYITIANSKSLLAKRLRQASLLVQ